MRLFSKSRNVVIDITASALTIYIVSYLLLGLSQLRPPLIYLLVGFVGFLLVLLFFLNLCFAVLHSNQRTAHIIMILTMIVTAVWLMPLYGKWTLNKQRRWFFQSGLQIYGRMVDQIVQSKAMLTSTNSALDYIVGCSDVYGKTNADGSLIVMFYRASFLRRDHVYLYYSGSNRIVNPIDKNTFSFPYIYGHFYYHLTNDWYESVP
jgi:hypothetical protein